MVNVETSVENEIQFTATKPFCRIMRGCVPLGMDLRRTCDELFSQSRDAKNVSGNGTGKANGIFTHEVIMSSEKPSVPDGEDNQKPGDCMKKS